MLNIALSEILAKLPVAKLQAEIREFIEPMTAILPDKRLCEFVIVASHLERLVEVYNDRLDRWETEHLQDLVDSVPWVTTYQAAFQHATGRIGYCAALARFS